jgi:aspartyl-tRNA(Asn)/glutamyl-tRNA(Gln) amidotransferase subunit A
VREAVRALEKLGARVVELAVPDPQVMNDVATIVSRCEGAATHARLAREHPEQIQPVVRARLELGYRIPAYDYLQALRLRARLTRTFVREVFSVADVLVAPVIPEPAPPLAYAIEGTVDELTERQGMFARLTRSFNGLGIPALALPCGFSQTGLPLAVQIAGRPFDEATVLRVGRAYERATGWSGNRPPID